MERHHKKREHLNNALEKHSNAKIGEVDIRLQRSPVVVEDFEIGRDVVFFPHGENMGNIMAEESINTGIPGRDRVKEVHLSYSANDSTSLPFLTLRLPQGQKNIKGGIANYVSELITAITPKAFGEKVNIISNSTQEQDVAEEREYIAQGPADHTVVVSRRKRAALKKLEEPIEVNTNEGNDYIVGSYGVERIDSGDGNDVLLPVAGNDVVDGNDGQDVVSYVSLYHPIAFEADTSGSVFASGTYFLYSVGDEDGSTEVEEGSFDRAELKNIEGYQAFGASTFDLSGLNEPEALVLKAKGANGEEEEGHLLKYLYSVKTGSGSSVVGSNYDDAIEVSYYQSFNEPVLSETAEFTISDEAFSRSSDIKAGVGNDLLLLDLSAAPLNQIKMAPSGDGFSILASIQG
jgi:hypothetical protein